MAVKFRDYYEVTFRDRWHILHAIRLALSAVAFSAAIGGLVA